MAAHLDQAGNFGDSFERGRKFAGNQAARQGVRRLGGKHRAEFLPPWQIGVALLERAAVHLKADRVGGFQFVRGKAVCDLLHGVRVAQGSGGGCEFGVTVRAPVQHGQEKIVLGGDVFIFFLVFHQTERDFRLFDQRVAEPRPVGGGSDIRRVHRGSFFVPCFQAEELAVRGQQDICLDALGLEAGFGRQALVERVAV